MAKSGSIFFTALTISWILNSSLSVPATNPAVGVVEGYYWTQADTVNGQWGHYSLTQRHQLLSLLASNGLGTYWYAPQSVDTMRPWTGPELTGWTATAALGSSLGVRIVYGLRPGWLGTNFTSQLAKVGELHAAGIRSYSLNFDDAEGVGTPEQQRREVSLAAAIRAAFPKMELYAIVPFCYYRNSVGSAAAWNRALRTIDGIGEPGAGMVTTGTVITPSTMSPSQFPSLSSGRRKAFWDNWTAEDSSARISWGLGISGSRDAVLFTAAYGYFLNLGFPLERVIHQVACVGELAAGGTCTAEAAAASWTSWLNGNGFLHGRPVATVKAALKNAILEDKYYESINALEVDVPVLAGIFSTPPVTNT